MTSFKFAFHRSTGRRIVEVFDDEGQFVGAIYPTDDGSNRIHIASTHFDEPEAVKPAPGGIVAVPGYQIRFKRRRP